MKWQLPAPRNFGWKMKPLESAKTAMRVHSGVLQLDIEHDIVRGVSPAMLAWWFSHIGGEMYYQGRRYPKYWVWHPLDHIHWALAKPDAQGGSGQGAYFRIVEAFDGNMAHLVDSVERVEALDERGIRLVRRVAGLEVFSLQHDFHPTPQGTRYISRMRVGASHALAQCTLNPIIQHFVFTPEMGRAWLRHNVEEVGNFEFFLPQHYAESAGQRV